MAVGILAGLVDIEPVVGVLEGGNRKPARHDTGNHFDEERGLARAAPAGEADDAHAMYYSNGKRPARARWALRMRERRLLGRSHSAFPGRRADVSLLGLLFEPQAVMLPRPIDVDGAVPHPLERTLHADGADIDVAEHGGDEQHRNHAMDDLGQLHGGDVGPVEWEHQEI